MTTEKRTTTKLVALRDFEYELEESTIKRKEGAQFATPKGWTLEPMASQQPGVTGYTYEYKVDGAYDVDPETQTRKPSMFTRQVTLPVGTPEELEAIKARRELERA